MHINKIEIKNFKCFKDVSINFDPNFNLIIGENNSGKSTIFEALRLWQLAFNKFLKDRTNNSSTSSFYSREYYSLTIEELNFLRIDNFKNLFYPNSKTIEISITVMNNQDFAVLPIFFTLNSEEQNLRFNLCKNGSERSKVSSYLIKVLNKGNGATFKDMLLMTYINPIFHLPIKEPKYQKGFILEKLHQAKANEVIRNLIDDYAPIDYQTTKNKSPKKRTKELEDVEQTLHEILTNKELGSDEVPLWSFTSNLKPDEDINISLFAKNRDNNIKVEISQLGSGTLNIINILAVLAYGDYERFKLTVLLLDEPDSHLHANHQKKLYEDLIKKSKDDNKQIFVITHNHELIDCAENVLFIDHEKIETHKKINLVSKNQYDEVYRKIAVEYHHKMIEIIEKKKIEAQLKNIQKPSLFCEGSTDVTILKHAYSKLFGTAFFNNELELHDGNSASEVALKIKHSVNQEITIIGLLDNDKEGKGQVQQFLRNGLIKKVNDYSYQKITKESNNVPISSHKSHLLLLPIPQFRSDSASYFEDNLIIEYMFTDDALEKIGVDLETLKGNTYRTLKGVSDKNQKLNIDEQKRKVIDNIQLLTKSDFVEFIPLFETIAQIINFKLPKVD